MLFIIFLLIIQKLGKPPKTAGRNSISFSSRGNFPLIYSLCCDKKDGHDFWVKFLFCGFTPLVNTHTHTSKYPSSSTQNLSSFPPAHLLPNHYHFYLKWYIPGSKCITSNLSSFFLSCSPPTSLSESYSSWKTSSN